MKENQFAPVVLTDEQKEWLVKHFKHTKNAVIAERLGCSVRSVTRIARKMGLQKSKQFVRKCQLNAAAEADRVNRELGLYPPKGYKIPNGEKGRFKKGERCIDRLGAKREAERLAKSVKSRNATFKLERARALFGLPRQTKLRVVRRPKKQAYYRSMLRSKGYIIAWGSNDIYYDNKTQRVPELELNPMPGFSFKQMSEYGSC